MDAKQLNELWKKIEKLAKNKKRKRLQTIYTKEIESRNKLMRERFENDGR